MLWLFGNYGRLSRDEKGEKLDSKETQLNYNAQFILDNKIGLIVGNYFDDDVSGTVFNREDLDRLKEDLIQTKINAVVTKDLSRLGRTNYKTLEFIEWLQENNFRLISINDNIDSLKGEDGYIGIKTWVNELYVRDTSVKIRSNIHQKLKQGQYLGTPPFGYKKEYYSVNNIIKPINKLIVDEAIRPIIVEIFDLYIKGYGYRNIADIMQSKGYPNPSTIKNYNRSRAPRWTKDHIKRIITNAVHAGDTVQGTSEKVSYKSKRTKRRPPEMWYITLNTHEPIIDRETWELANQINKKRATQNSTRNKGRIYTFSGFLECGACGKFLCARNVKDRPLGYICSNYFHFGKKDDGKIGGCESHHVRHDLLEQLIYQDIINQLNEENLESIFNKYLSSGKDEKDHSKPINQLKKDVEKYNQQLNIVYEDRLNGVISVDYYQSKTEDIERKIEGFKQQIINLEQEMLQKNTQTITKDKLKSTFLEMTKGKQLTREVLEKAIRRIYVVLPNDIRNEDKEGVVLKMGTDIETIERLQAQGGIFIKYDLSM